MDGVLPHAIFPEVSHSEPTLSPQADKVIVSGFAAGLLIMLAGSLVVASAPVAIALAPVGLLLALGAAIGRDVRHVARHGWYLPRGDGRSGPGGTHRPHGPQPQQPSGDLIDPEWDSFVSQFWEHVAQVEREREPVPTA